jgi:NIMA (never in mitosis gene a)-related kinase 2
MSPELMQEKAYDSKSDIWSLGCLIFELCAWKPPFHEAKTHAELSILIRNGRIPPLPKGYSPALSSVIKAMLNLNPAMRPSAAQLLQHERLDLAFKVAETQKMYVYASVPMPWYQTNGALAGSAPSKCISRLS